MYLVCTYLLTLYAFYRGVFVPDDVGLVSARANSPSVYQGMELYMPTYICMVCTYMYV